MVETKARPSLTRKTAASSKGASPTSSPAADASDGVIDLTSAASGDPPHLAAQPPHEVHSVKRSDVSTASATTRVSQEREDAVGVRRMETGTKVDVRTTFDRTWARGFEVLEATPEGYRLRRLSDGAALPAVFPDEDVRRARRDDNMWWT